MTRRVVMMAMAAIATSALLSAQQRPASPAGTAATQIGTGPAGKWIEITSGRPIKRGRDLFGSGADYGTKLNAGAPVWRAGANVSTRLKSEVPLQIGGKTVPAGEYSLFIQLKSPSDWTLIVSSWGAKASGKEDNPNALWGAYNYTPDKDVVRAPMTVNKMPMSMDQLTWAFVDMTDKGGKLAIMWDTVAASVPFTIGQ